MFGPEAINIGSEVVLALYPILIKLADQNLFRQLVARFATFFTASVAFCIATDTTKDLIVALLNPSLTIGLGLIYIVHVASSYYAFKELDAGTAMSLFYTYPFWNLLAGAVLFREKITPMSIVLLIISIVGVYLVSQQADERFTGQDTGAAQQQNWKGVAAGLLSALTETAIFVAMRLLSVKEPASPAAFIASHTVLGTILAAVLPALLPAVQTTVLSGTSTAWIQMVLFNAIIGFGGYALRMYVIPRLSTSTFSILSVIGAVAAFFWGWLYAEETPTLQKLIGAGLITGASAFVI